MDLTQLVRNKQVEKFEVLPLTAVVKKITRSSTINIRFNPRAREERDPKGLGQKSYRLRFNPRAREERDHHAAHRLDKLPFVSIHALAKSATGGWAGGDSDYRVSIHALAKSATLRGRLRGLLKRSFNPRAREERDGSDKLRLPRPSVSIHALAKSATTASGTPQGILSSFNPRAREERDPSGALDKCST